MHACSTVCDSLFCLGAQNNFSTHTFISFKSPVPSFLGGGVTHDVYMSGVDGIVVLFLRVGNRGVYPGTSHDGLFMSPSSFKLYGTKILSLWLFSWKTEA